MNLHENRVHVHTAHRTIYFRMHSHKHRQKMNVFSFLFLREILVNKFLSLNFSIFRFAPRGFASVHATHIERNIYNMLIVVD